MTAPFMFFDLRTSDVATAREFYTSMFGWTVTDIPAGDEKISLLTDETGPWGGFTRLPPGDQRHPQWTPYAPVDDLGAATERARSLGATVLRDRVEMPGGTLAVIEDPTGASLVLWEADGR
jgi:hypothetical protein